MWLCRGGVSDSSTCGPETMHELERSPVCAPLKVNSRLLWQKLGPKTDVSLQSYQWKCRQTVKNCFLNVVT